ncbi:MAG: NusG domain II-containing protein [Lachnospiraceae bacterium]|nr:NusG domain II-containing protein [Lachnospiraceae bacterium]
MFKKKDIIIYASVLLLIGAAYLITALIRSNRSEGAYARISVNGLVIADYPLDRDIETIITGYSDGNLKLIIKDGTAYIESSTCPDKICVRHRAVSRTGESIICMPNRVVVEIISDEDAIEIDAVSKALLFP